MLSPALISAAAIPVSNTPIPNVISTRFILILILILMQP